MDKNTHKKLNHLYNLMVFFVMRFLFKEFSENPESIKVFKEEFDFDFGQYLQIIRDRDNKTLFRKNLQRTAIKTYIITSICLLIGFLTWDLVN